MEKNIAERIKVVIFDADDTLQHERAEEYSHPRLIRLDSIGQLPGMLLQATMPESSGKASII